MKKIILTLIVLAALGASVYAYYKRKAVVEPTVTTMPLSRGDIAETVQATGTLEAVETVDVGTQVSGVVDEMAVDFNDIVKKGQVIARLDPSIIQTQIEQAKANVTRAEADLDRLRVNLADAKRKFEQAKLMWEKQLIPRDQYETAELNVKTQESQIRSSEAGLIQTKSQLNTQEVNLGHTVIRAPIDGIVISRSVDQGQTVAASMNAPVLYVIAADLTKMQIIANIDESEIGRMRTGQPVTFRVDAYPTDTFRGVVHQVRLLPTTVQNVVTYSTVISVPNPDYKLKPGMTGNVTIEIARRDNVLRAPAAALRFRPSNDVFAALKQEVPPEMARGAGGGRGPGGGGRGQGGGQGGGQATPAGTPAAGTPATTPANPAQAPAAAPQGQRRPEGQDATARPGGGDRSGDRPAGENRGGGGRGNSNMTPEEREARRKQFEERMKNMTPEERAAMQQRGGGRGGFQRGGDTAAAGQGGRGSNPSMAGNRQGGGTRQGTGARDNQPAGRLSDAQTVDALFAPLAPTEGRGRLWLFADKKLKSVNVRTGISDGTWTEILEGGDASQLQPETTVVTNVVTGMEPAPRPGQQNPGGSPLMGGQRGGGPGGQGAGGSRPVMAILQVRDLVKTYHVGEHVVRALRGANMDVQAGEFVAITGPSGSGKSTLMHILGCLDRPTSGQYILDGNDVSRMSKDELAVIRNRKIGFVFQGFNLLSRTTALDNVELPLLYNGSLKMKTSDRHKRALEALTSVGLGNRYDHFPNQLSGGQQQRVAIARALVTQPAILLADEPTGNLDTRTSIEVMDIFQTLNKERGITILLITHEMDIAEYGTRFIRFRDGKIQIDSPVHNRRDAKKELAALPPPEEDPLPGELAEPVVEADHGGVV